MALRTRVSLTGLGLAAIWVLAALLAVRDLSGVFAAHPDAVNFVTAGKITLTHPGRLYAATATYLALHHGVAPSGPSGFFYSPALSALLAVPFALLPLSTGVAAWVLADTAAVLAALIVLYRGLRPAGFERPLFWLVVAYFTPLWAEIAAGQRGGLILLLAVVAMALAGRRPLAAGLLAGVAAAAKLYPASMLLGAGPRRLPRFGGGLVLAATGLGLAAFIPFGGPVDYVRGVLAPAGAPDSADCGINSVRTMWYRTVGGAGYIEVSGGHDTLLRAPLDLPWLAAALTLLTVLGLVVATVAAARAAGWPVEYGLALAFSLGALIPGEVYQYQSLPLLPLALMLVVVLLRARRPLPLTVLGLSLLCFAPGPCFVPFPYVWVVGGLGIFAVGVWQYRCFRGGQLGGFTWGSSTLRSTSPGSVMEPGGSAAPEAKSF